MGKEDSNRKDPNHARRKAPPSLQSKPGAQSVPGPGAAHLGQVEMGSLSTARYGKTDDTGPRTGAFRSGGATDPAMAKSKSNRSMGKASSTSNTEDSSAAAHSDTVEATLAPAALPLESDYFDRAMPELRRHKIIPIVLIALTAVLAIVIPTSVILSRNEKTHTPAVRATAAPLAAKRNMTLEELHLKVPGLTQDTLDQIISDPASPQALALSWCNGDPYDWDAYEDWRKVQRYGMAVVFYALNGPGWESYTIHRIEWLRHHQDECAWMDNARDKFEPMCNEDGQFVSFQAHDVTYLKGVFPREIGLLSHLQLIGFKRGAMGDRMEDLFHDLLEAGDGDVSPYLPSLERLVLSDEQISGEIPSFLASITTLTQLDLSQNYEMSQSIPSELGLLTNLSSLDLSLNKLTGTIPKEIGQLPLLTEFSVNSNQLTTVQPLPESFCQREFEWTVLITDWCGGEESKHCCSA